MPDRTSSLAQFNELIHGISTAVLTTVRPDGSLHSCPMATHAVDQNGVLWFLTHHNSEKVEAVRTQQHVNVTYADHAAQRYVSVSGFCELVRDHAIAERLWDPGYSSWLPGGPEKAVLLKIDIQHVEYWDAAQGRMATLVGLPRVL